MCVSDALSFTETKPAHWSAPLKHTKHAKHICECILDS